MAAKILRAPGTFLSLLATLICALGSSPSRLMTRRRGAAHIVIILLVIIIVLLVLIIYTY
jgi:cell division septal protein FtsQ